MPGWSHRAPPAAKFVANRTLQALDPLARQAYRIRHQEARTVPPRALRARCGQPGIGQFLRDGGRAAAELEGLLEELGRPLSSFESVCDFGAGTGRVLLQLERSPARLSARDVDSAAMAWLRTNHPHVDAVGIGAAPPVATPDGAFDLIYALSVFTHLNEDSQHAWLRELRRLLRPDGIAVLTVHGPTLYDAHRTGRRGGLHPEGIEALGRRSTLRDEGFVFQAYERSPWNRWKLRGTEPDYGLAFHSPGYIRRAWAETFEVLDVLPARLNWRQDAVVLGRRADSSG